MSKVDILLATYNGEQFLKSQIDSILNQTYTDFRLLISDDHSSDSTVSILKEYAKLDKRIVLFFQEKNLGIMKNFEFLLSKVESDYYMFSDQDDVWNEDKIMLSIEKLENTSSDIVFSDLEVVDTDLNVIYDSYWKLKGFYKKIKKYNSFEALYLTNYVTGCTMISKSEYINECLPFPDSKYILYDYWIALILSKSHKISYIEKPLIKYRQHKHNTIGSKKKSNELKSIDEIRKLFIDVKKDHFSSLIQNEDKFFSEDIKSLNHKSLEYFEMLENKKNFNFRGWALFSKLYKYENFKYRFENFLVLNLPFFARILFKIRSIFK